MTAVAPASAAACSDLSQADLDRGREVLRFCNSYSRLPTLGEIWGARHGECGWREWLTLLGEEWEVCDDIGFHTEWLIEDSPLADALQGHGREHLMNEEERAAYAALPDEFEVWRGCYAANAHGLSWSLERSTAERFPTLHRYRGEGRPMLIRARARKAEVAAIKLRRNEAEVITWRPRIISKRFLQGSA